MEYDEGRPLQVLYRVGILVFVSTSHTIILVTFSLILLSSVVIILSLRGRFVHKQSGFAVHDPTLSHSHRMESSKSDQKNKM